MDPATWNWAGIVTWAWRAAPLVLALVGITWVAILAGELHDITGALRDLRQLLGDEPERAGRHSATTDPEPPDDLVVPARPPAVPPAVTRPPTAPTRITVHRVPADTNPLAAAATAPTWNGNSR